MALLGTGTLRIDHSPRAEELRRLRQLPAGGRRHRDRPQRERHGRLTTASVCRASIGPAP
jgi:hypothetical protein